MTSNSEQPQASRGILPLSVLALILALILAWYLNMSPSAVTDVPASMLPDEGSEETTTTALVSTESAENADDSEGDTESAENDEGDSAGADSVETDSAETDNDAETAADTQPGEDNDENSAATDSDSESAAVEDSDEDTAESDEGESAESSTADSDSADSDSADSDSADSGSADGDADSEPVASNKPAPNTIAGTYNDMPVGYTDDGLVFRGDPDAPVTIYEFSDYQCPFCLRHFSQTETALDETYVQTGQAKVVFVDFPLVQLHPNAPTASAAALCVAEQSPVEFWKMHALIFETQNQWSNSAEPAAFFEDLSTQLEIDSTSFSSCLESGRADAMVERSYAWGRSLGFSGTPSFQFALAGTEETYDLVGAQPFDRFQSWMDAFAAGEVPPDAAQQANAGAQGGGEQEIPYWATEEGLSADPDREGFTMAGDAFRGNPDASIVVIEYSDFQCPFCRRHTTDTQPILDEQFVATDQVRWVFRHFPLNIHPQAPMAGVSAECAGEQGQFWEMHELLFETMSAWSISDPKPYFIELATQLSLETDAFAACLDDEEMMARIDSDFADGRPFVNGTPTFIVMTGGEGRIIPGALPADTFAQALQDIISEGQ